MGYESIKFISFDNFYKNKKSIRCTYRKLLLRDKIAFKHYVYYELKECEMNKNVIWNFLNENENCRKELMLRVHARNKDHNK